MKVNRFLNSVEKKYMVGYILIFIFMIIFMISTIGTNIYISEKYSKETDRLLTINNLEESVGKVNDSVDVAYFYLSMSGIEDYYASNQETNEWIRKTTEQLQNQYVREVMDSVKTIETYLQKSNSLIERLQVYIEGKEEKASVSGELVTEYEDVQSIYSYIYRGFQDVYSAELNGLRSTEEKLGMLQKVIIAVEVILLLLISAATSIYLRKNITGISRSIEMLMEGVESVERDVFLTEQINIESNDEFEEFANAFNKMVTIIQMQMKKIEENADIREKLAKAEIEKLRICSDLQKKQLEFLQSRINPHFLFNTLNMISSLAFIEDAPQSAELMKITAAYLRYNLDNITKTVTLKKEIDNLKDYVVIQRCRYGDRYSYSFEVDEDCLSFMMPCMILQPLVENAIQHGLAMRIKGGQVRVKAKYQEEFLYLEVGDNGEGMDEKAIDDIYRNMGDKEYVSAHMGIANVYQRLQIFYRNEAKLEMQNRNPGLCVTIVLPRRKGDAEK